MKIEMIGQGMKARAYVVADEAQARALVIDPGDCLSSLEDLFVSQGLKLTGVLLTHGHLAHSARASELCRKHRVPLGVHSAELVHLQQLPVEGDRAGLCGVKSPQVGRYLREGDVWEFGRLKLHVIETPGHTDGSLTFRIEEAFFIGDLSAAHEMSIEKIRSLVPAKATIYPGHGDPFLSSEL